MKGKRVRLDVFLAGKGLYDSREKAKRDIMAGWVRVNGETVREASYAVTGDEDITVERPGGFS
jgi:23S rRNA (cytidine1920-2'-O)/16S rRNA (cytidine1409-2'-O)-methyltransferase